MVQVFVVGTTTGEVTEDEGIDATGQLDGIFTILGTPAGTEEMEWTISDPPEFGTVTLEDIDGDPAGLDTFIGDSVVWRYELDSDNPAVSDLVLGEDLPDSFVISATPTDGGDTIFQTIDITIFGVCFAGGTLIETETGFVAVEHLRAGMRVLTQDAGYQPIVWMGGGPCPEADWRADASLLPVRIRAGSLGAGCPSRDLFVSQNHRILLRGARAELLFGEPEVLIAAKHLCALPDVDVVTPSGSLSYHHILCGAHHVLLANDCPAESMLLGDEALATLSPKDVVALDARLQQSDIHEVDPKRMAVSCRRILSRHEAALLLGTNATELLNIAA
ncbi:MAG: Hint domain-containing protein [Pseudomonadota bacterium]